jgi:hypothetical protein
VKKNGLVAILILVVVAAVAAMLYRSISGDDLSDDEWFEFETPDDL